MLVGELDGMFDINGCCVWMAYNKNRVLACRSEKLMAPPPSHRTTKTHSLLKIAHIPNRTTTRPPLSISINHHHQHAYYYSRNLTSYLNHATTCTPTYSPIHPSQNTCEQYSPLYAETSQLFNDLDQQAMSTAGNLHISVHVGGPLLQVRRECIDRPVPTVNAGLSDFEWEIKGRQISYNIFSDL